MKRLAMIIAAFMVLVSVDAVHATVIDVFSIRQSVDTTRIGAHSGYQLYFLVDNPVDLTTCEYGGVSKLTGIGVDYLIPILQRTLQYEEENKWGDMPFPESISMFEANTLWGLLLINGTTDYAETFWNLNGIPDLSRYTINSMYALDFTSASGYIDEIDIRIIADVTPVPEPSSFLLTALGAAAALFTSGVRRRGTA